MSGEGGAISADSQAMAAAMRAIVIERSFPVRTGHIGSSLSVVDLLAVLFSGPLRHTGAQRDRFVLSKGHAALALYAALSCSGVLDEGDLATYCRDGSALGEHPDHVVPGVEFSSGSLGFGLSLGTGLALSARLRGADQRAFVLMSDAELNEGAIWEAAMFAAHHRLGNLVLVLDLNGQQAMGRSCDVLELGSLPERFSAFGWHAQAIDGHDHDAIGSALEALDEVPDRPHVLCATTTFGKGVGFMERQLGWHYWSMSAEQYDAARAEIAIGVGDAR